MRSIREDLKLNTKTSFTKINQYSSTKLTQNLELSSASLHHNWTQRDDHYSRERQNEHCHGHRCLSHKVIDDQLYCCCWQLFHSYEQVFVESGRWKTGGRAEITLNGTIGDTKTWLEWNYLHHPRGSRRAKPKHTHHPAICWLWRELLVREWRPQKTRKKVTLHISWPKKLKIARDALEETNMKMM